MHCLILIFKLAIDGLDFIQPPYLNASKGTLSFEVKVKDEKQIDSVIKAINNIMRTSYNFDVDQREALQKIVSDANALRLEPFKEIESNPKLRLIYDNLIQQQSKSLVKLYDRYFSTKYNNPLNNIGLIATLYTYDIPTEQCEQMIIKNPDIAELIKDNISVFPYLQKVGITGKELSEMLEDKPQELKDFNKGIQFIIQSGAKKSPNDILKIIEKDPKTYYPLIKNLTNLVLAESNAYVKSSFIQNILDPDKARSIKDNIEKFTALNDKQLPTVMKLFEIDSINDLNSWGPEYKELIDFTIKNADRISSIIDNSFSMTEVIELHDSSDPKERESLNFLLENAKPISLLKKDIGANEVIQLHDSSDPKEHELLNFLLENVEKISEFRNSFKDKNKPSFMHNKNPTDQINFKELYKKDPAKAKIILKNTTSIKSIIDTKKYTIESLLAIDDLPTLELKLTESSKIKEQQSAISSSLKLKAEEIGKELNIQSHIHVETLNAQRAAKATKKDPGRGKD